VDEIFIGLVERFAGPGESFIRITGKVMNATDHVSRVVHLSILTSVSC
jgi:hypothetical protein